MTWFARRGTAALLAAGIFQGHGIGAALFDGARLVYQADGVEQAPWVYDSVRVVDHGTFERCVMIFRAGQPARRHCVRGDTLFQQLASGALVPARPIGPGMWLEIPTAAGGVAEYRTGERGHHRVEGLGREIGVIATTILIRDSTGRATQRLTEEYAPELLTALGGVFESPDTIGQWRQARIFLLREVRPAP